GASTLSLHDALPICLSIASAGLAVIGLGSALLAVSMVIRLTRADTTIALELPTPVVMGANLLVLVGFITPGARVRWVAAQVWWRDRKSTRLNSSHDQ